LAVGEVGSEPAVDAVAMEENGSLKASFVGHLGVRNGNGFDSL
jgi:hypothetical protein